MENEAIESILEAVKKLQQEQKNMMAKFTKLTEVCRNKINKLENEKLESNKAFENQFARIEKNFDDNETVRE